MTQVLTWIVAAILIVGGMVAWDLTPSSWLDRLPTWGRLALVTCAIVFSLFIVLGYVLDSGLFQRIFKRKP